MRMANDVGMETTASIRPAHQHDVFDLRASVRSIQESSKDAIARLDKLIAQQGAYTDIATGMREAFADFHKLAEDIRSTSDFVEAALQSR